jgi:hypothetical protein
MPLVGNTITIRGTFPSDIGDLNLLTDVKLTIYTQDLKITLASITSVDKISNGVYEANYIISDKDMPRNLIYEFSGTLNGFIYLGRGYINREYV